VKSPFRSLKTAISHGESRITAFSTRIVMPADYCR
jgi:hypothetical protein